MFPLTHPPDGINIPILLLRGKDPGLPPPNILWITAEDISPWLGCYGDPNATTPNLDKLASKGVLYQNAFANAPVCAPARSTIITGCIHPDWGLSTCAAPMRSLILCACIPAT